MKIEKLKIFTPNLQEQIRFYTQVLEQELVNETEDSFELRIGYSLLQFVEDPDATPYHIAFHIPANQEELALEWLRGKTNILLDEGRDLVDFPNWNASSVYFYDSDKNILEFISRRHLHLPNVKLFAAESVLGISEIGLAVTDVNKANEFLNSHFQLQKFTEFGPVFCAIGDEQGLFIVIDRNEKDWFPSEDTAFPSAFEIEFTVQGKNGAFTYKNERLKLL